MSLLLKVPYGNSQTKLGRAYVNFHGALISVFSVQSLCPLCLCGCITGQITEDAEIAQRRNLNQVTISIFYEDCTWTSSSTDTEPIRSKNHTKLHSFPTCSRMKMSSSG